MADVLLSAKGIKIRFGGVVAADRIDLDVLDRRKPRDHRTERRRKDHVPQHLDRLLAAASR